MEIEVLIIDDDDVIVFIHERIIIENKFNTRPKTFSNAKSGLDYLQNFYDPDKRYFILLDINMPEVNGWNFLESIKHQIFYKNVAVLMITSSVNEIDKEKSLEYSQVIGFIEKPLTKEKLTEIREAQKYKAFLEK